MTRFDQPDFDAEGYRYVRCLNCFMGCVEHRDDPQELLPGMMTRADRFVDYHECPEPYSEETARMMLLSVMSSGVPISSRQRARLWLALRETEDAGEFAAPLGMGVEAK